MFKKSVKISPADVPNGHALPTLGGMELGCGAGMPVHDWEKKKLQAGGLFVRPCENTLYLAPERFWQL